MLAYIRGKVLALESDRVLLLTASGLGYAVFLTGRELSNCRLGEEAAFYTYLAVKEDNWSLYGFKEQEEKRIFELFLKVSGVGPKVALSILSCLSLSEIGQAMSEGDTALFTKVPGIGKKTAERIVLELKDKMQLSAFKIAGSSLNGAAEELTEILMALGYSEEEARKAAAAVRKMPENSGKTADKLLPQALRYLTP